MNEREYNSPAVLAQTTYLVWLKEGIPIAQSITRWGTATQIDLLAQFCRATLAEIEAHQKEQPHES